MYLTNMVNHCFGDGILVVILSKPVVNNGSMRNLLSNLDLENELESIDLILFVLARKENPYPFCLSSPKPGLSKRICAYTYDKIVMCNLVEYPNALPLEYQVCSD